MSDETFDPENVAHCLEAAVELVDSAALKGLLLHGSAALAGKDAEIERLRAGIRKVIEEGAPRKVAEPYDKDGRPHKGDRCPHGMFTWDSCGNCTDEYLASLLSEMPVAAPQPTQEPRSGVPGSGDTPGKPSGDTR